MTRFFEQPKVYLSFVAVCLALSVAIVAGAVSGVVTLPVNLTATQPSERGDGRLVPRPAGLAQALREDTGLTVGEFMTTRSPVVADFTNVGPGAELAFPTDGGALLCSAGAWTVLYGSPMLLTAGHCSPTGEREFTGLAADGRRTVLGSSMFSVLDTVGTVDIMAARAEGRNSVLVGDGASADLVLGEPVLGAPACANGRSSGWRCGTLLSDDDVTLCSRGGDSGGPVIQGNRIVGFIIQSLTLDNQPVCVTSRNSRGTYNTGRSDVTGSHFVSVPTALAALDASLN